MATVNIRRDVTDKFYRYKMPVLTIKIEGKGNGIKTVIPPMSDIARALNRPPAYPTKFFGCELGAQTTSDDKGDRYIVNGAHDAARLRELLDSFIDKFVLCPSCKNPETELILAGGKNKETITKDCKACGHKGLVDMTHKLCTFILKNPPPKAGAYGEKFGKKDKKGNKKDKGDEKDGPEDGSEEGEDNGDTNGHHVEKIEEEKDVIAGKEVDIPDIAQLKKKVDDDWKVDTSKEAVEARMKQLGVDLQKSSLIDGDEDEEGAGGVFEEFGNWVKEHKGSVSDVEIYRKAEEMGIVERSRTLTVLVQALFDENVKSEIQEHLAIFKKMTGDSTKHQKALLGGFERLIGISYPDQLLNEPSIRTILTKLYNSDILEEEVLMDWGSHVSKKYVDKETSKKVRKNSKAFLKALAEAEEEDD